jgi:hypothetical protein
VVTTLWPKREIAGGVASVPGFYSHGLGDFELDAEKSSHVGCSAEKQGRSSCQAGSTSHCHKTTARLRSEAYTTGPHGSIFVLWLRG